MAGSRTRNLTRPNLHTTKPPRVRVVVVVAAACISFVLFDAAEQDTRNLEDLEELVWDGNRAPPDQQIDQFMILARQVNWHGFCLAAYLASAVCPVHSFISLANIMWLLL